jgi:Na+/proline symporter
MTAPNGIDKQPCFSYSVLGGLWAVVIADFLQASILLPFCIVLAVASLIHVGGVSGLAHSLPPAMKTIHVHGEFGWIYLACWAVMVSFGYNTSAMAQRYFSVENEHAARKVALLCSGPFSELFSGLFRRWRCAFFIPTCMQYGLNSQIRMKHRM